MLMYRVRIIMLLLILGCLAACDSGTNPGTIAGNKPSPVADADDALRVFKKYVAGPDHGFGRNLDHYEYRVERDGERYWRVYLTNTMVGIEALYFVDVAGAVHAADPGHLHYVFQPNNRPAEELRDREAVMQEVIDMHLGQRNVDVKFISSVSEIPGYASHPMDADMEQVIRPAWEKHLQPGTTVYVRYAYSRSGAVGRYEFRFFEDAPGLMGVKFIMLATGVGDYVGFD